MAVVWTFNVPDAGTRRVFSIEDRIWDGQRMSVSATVGRTLGTSRGVLRQIRTRGGGLGDDFNAASLQRHFWVRNAPYAVKDRGNSLKSQEMRPPSERTTSKSHEIGIDQLQAVKPRLVPFGLEITLPQSAEA
jgi:hypothetical protein